jgi:hypothetical protein
MHAILLTVLTLPGAGGPTYGELYPPGYGEPVYAGEMAPCDGHGHAKAERGGCLGPMPQSCYNPSFGCYPSTRFMHRYPAFHGTYYRQAYNYRNYFDYPWHAGLHEPTSHFSYNVPAADAVPTPPLPLPDAASRRLRSVRTASSPAPIVNSSEVRR